MTIQIKDGRYFKGFMNFEFRKNTSALSPKSDGNLLAAVYTDDKETWHLVYRFRYYIDELVHNSKDDRNWYHATMKPGDKGTEDTVWKGVVEAMGLMASASGSTLHCVLVESDDAKEQAEKLLTLPGMSIQTEGDA